MMISREFIDYPTLFPCDDNIIVLGNALEEVYSSVCDVTNLVRDVDISISQVTGDYKVFLPDRVIPFKRRVSVDDHTRWKVWNEVSNAIMSIPPVADQISQCNNYIKNVSVHNTKGCFIDAIRYGLWAQQRDSLAINHRDLVRYYLGLNNIPAEKVFNLL